MDDRYEVGVPSVLADPAAFWAEAAAEVEWFRPWDQVIDSSRPPFTRWFPGAMVNTCHNAVDRWVARPGWGDRTALIYDSAMTGEVRSYSYRALRDAVARFAGVLHGLGVIRASASSSTCRWCPRW